MYSLLLVNQSESHWKMFLLVGFSSRHVLPTANQLQIGEPRERGFPRQIGGTVPAVSPKDTSAHPFAALRRRHGTFLTHLSLSATRPVSRLHVPLFLSAPWNTWRARIFLHLARVLRGATLYSAALHSVSRNFETRFAACLRDVEIDVA